MPSTLPSPVAHQKRAVKPSILDPAAAKPFTLDQELELFGSWVGEPI